MKEHHFRKPLVCPWCHQASVTVTGLATAKPSAGEGYVCTCGQLSVFLGPYELRKPDYDEALKLLKSSAALYIIWLATQKWIKAGRPPL